MPQYKLNPDQIAQTRKKLLTRVLPIMGVFLLIIAFTQGYNMKTGEFNLTSTLIVIAIFAALSGWSFYRILSKQKKVYESYRITLHDNLIIGEQSNSPRIEIYVNEIASMEKTYHNYIIIRGKSPQEIIYIPPQLENYEDLERRLEEIMLITPAKRISFLQRYRLLVMLAMLILFIVSMGAPNAIVAAACGTPVIALSLYIFFAGMQNKNFDNRAKRSLWVFLVMPLVIAANIVLKVLSI